MVDGQMTLFEYEERISYKEPEKLLKMGQMVYVVQKGDVEKCTVVDESWLCGDGDSDRGYRVIKESGCYGVVHNSKINQSMFVDEERANRNADKFLAEHKVIRAVDINILNVVAYGYTRDVDGRRMKAFYCDIGNGLLYMKDFMTFHHIMRNCDKTIKEFMKEIDEIRGYGADVERIEHTPVPKNMYLCNGGNWLYAEAGCSYGAG